MRSGMRLTCVFAVVGCLALWAPVATGGWVSMDIGTPGAAGSSSGSPPGAVTIYGDGNDIWGNSDNFHFAYDDVQVTGDFKAMARLTSQQNTNSWAKAGIMARAELTGGSIHVHTSGTISNGITQQWRDSTDGGSAWQNTAIPGSPNSSGQPYWLFLERNGNTLSSRWAPDVAGSPGGWSLAQNHTSSSMPASVYLGLSVTSHNDGTLCEAIFDNIDLNYTGEIYTAVTGTPQSDPGTAAGLAAQVVHTTAGYDMGNISDAINRLNLQPGDAGHYASQVTSVPQAHVHTHGQTTGGETLLLQNERSGTNAPTDQYAVRLAGWFQTTTANEKIDFMLRHDDACRVTIGNTMVADVGGWDNNNPVYFNAEIPTAGWWPIEVIGQQGGGGVGWELYSRAGGTANPYEIIGSGSGLQVKENPGAVPAPGDRGANPAGAPISTSTGTPDGLRVQVVYGAPNFANTAEAVAFLKDPANATAGTIVLSQTPFDYRDPDNGSDGLWTPTNPFPGETPGTDDDHFAMRINGLVYIPAPGDYSVSTGGDDGFQLRVGQNMTSYATDPRGHPGADDTNIGHVRFEQAGLYPFEYYYFENGGGASSELGFGEYTGLLVTSRNPQDHGFVSDPRQYGVQLYSVAAKARLVADGTDLKGAAYADVPGLGGQVRPEYWKLEEFHHVASSGLRAQWYPNETFTGPPAFDVIAPTVDRDNQEYPGTTWTGDQNNFSVRYTGEVYADHAGDFRFREEVDDECWLVIDGTEVLHDGSWNTHTDTLVALTEGWHDIEFRTREGSGGDYARLMWDPTGGTTWEIVPEDVLRIEYDWWELLADGTDQLGGPTLEELLASYDPMQDHLYRLTTQIAGLEATDELSLQLIPEPATVALLAFAAAGLGGYVRRRRKA